MTSLTALIPAFFGLAILILGLVVRLEKRSKNTPLFGAVFLAILVFLGSVRGLMGLYTMLTGGEVARPATTISQSLIVAICILFVGLAVILTKNFWHGWKEFGHFLGNLLGRVVLTIFYFTIFVPFGLGVLWLSDPLQIKTRPNSLWRPRSTGDQTLADVGRQF